MSPSVFRYWTDLPRIRSMRTNGIARLLDRRFLPRIGHVALPNKSGNGPLGAINSRIKSVARAGHLGSTPHITSGGATDDGAGIQSPFPWRRVLGDREGMAR